MVFLIELFVVQLDPTKFETYHPRVEREIQRIIEDMKRKSGDLAFLVGTVEYSVYKHLLRSAVPVKFFPNESAFETSAKLYVQAQKIARKLVEDVGERALFRDVNLFEAILFDVTATFHTILRMSEIVRSRTNDAGTIILLTEMKLFASQSEDSALPIKKLIHISTVRSKIEAATRIYLVKVILRAGLSALARLRNLHSTLQSEITVPLDNGKRTLFIATESSRVDICAEPLSFILSKMKEHPDLSGLVAVDSSLTQRYLEEKGFACLRFIQSNDWEGQVHWLLSRGAFKKAAMRTIKQKESTYLQLQMIRVFMNNYLSLRTPFSIYSRVTWLTEMFDRFRPDVVVVLPTYPHLSMIATRIARNRGIPTLTSVLTWPCSLRPDPGAAIYATGFIDVADYVALPGEDSRDAFTASGISAGKLILVGNPKFDAILNASAWQDRARVYKQIGGTATGHIFVVTTYLIAPGTKEWIQALVRQLRKLDPDTFTLIIRPHPDEGAEIYEQILTEQGLGRAIVSKDIPLYTLLNACDVVFTTISATGSEAVLFDKPLISINLLGGDLAVRYDLAGVALYVTKEEEILPAIDAVLNGEEQSELRLARKRFQKRCAYKLDGKSSERFVEVTRTLANRVPIQSNL